MTGAMHTKYFGIFYAEKFVKTLGGNCGLAFPMNKLQNITYETNVSSCKIARCNQEANQESIKNLSISLYIYNIYI